MTDQSSRGTRQQLPNHGIEHQPSPPWQQSGVPPQRCQEGPGPREAYNSKLHECGLSCLHAYDWSSDHEQDHVLVSSVGCALRCVQFARDSEARGWLSQRRGDCEGEVGWLVEEIRTKTGRRRNTPQLQAVAGWPETPCMRGRGHQEWG